MSFRSGRIVTCMLALAVFFNAGAQDSTTADGLFSLARKAAFEEKDYGKALGYSKRALQIAPNYSDIIVFTGRVFMWNGQNDSARVYLNRAISVAPTSADNYAALADLELQEKDQNGAIDVLDQGLGQAPADTLLILKKARILYDLKRYEAANETLLINKTGERHPEWEKLYELVWIMLKKNTISVSYDHVTFSDLHDEDWKIGSVHYTRRTKSGPLTARISNGSRFGNEAYQYELESNPRFSPSMYSFINVGISTANGVFPEWKAAFSLMRSFSAKWEAEVGARLVTYGKTYDFYTAYIGRYHGKFLTGIRGFLAPGIGTVESSFIFTTRYYTGKLDDHFLFQVQAGRSPDEKSNVVYIGSYSSGGVGAAMSKRLGLKNILTLNFLYQRQEFSADRWSNDIQAGIGLARQF